MTVRHGNLPFVLLQPWKDTTPPLTIKFYNVKDKMFPTKEVKKSDLKDEENDTWLDEPSEETEPARILHTKFLPHICLASTYLTSLLADRNSVSAIVEHKGSNSLQKAKVDAVLSHDDFTLDFQSVDNVFRRF